MTEQNQTQDGADQVVATAEQDQPAAPGATAGATAGTTEAPPAEAKQPDPKAEIDRLQQEKRELNDRMLRIAADYENYKRRVRREMEDAGLRGMDNLLREILPVLDNLDRALDAASRSTDVTVAAGALVEGVRMVQKQFLGALEKVNVKAFDAQGKPFDPAFHEAVQQIESDSLEPGTVATVFQRGYTAGPRLLRPALVAVVRGRPQPAQEAAATDKAN